MLKYAREDTHYLVRVQCDQMCVMPAVVHVMFFGRVVVTVAGHLRPYEE